MGSRRGPRHARQPLAAAGGLPDRTLGGGSHPGLLDHSGGRHDLLLQELPQGDLEDVGGGQRRIGVCAGPRICRDYSGHLALVRIL